MKEHINNKNEFSNEKENNSSLLKRLYIYQKERFPLLGHGILITAFSFSAISYSRISRGESNFVSMKAFLIGIFTTITLFLLVRIFDEFKDAKDDAAYRKNLPVPRGLVKLSELRTIAIIVIVLQIAINAFFFPKMLLLYALVMVYLFFMTKEFFIEEWLRKNQFWYVVSHMFIIPLVDVYASGLDWLLENEAAPKGLLFFFAVSYMNGVVLEIGRKIKIKEDEAEGVLTYSGLLGAKKATSLWILILFCTYLLSLVASYFADYGNLGFIILTVFFVIFLIPAFFFLAHQTKKSAKAIEISSGLWTIMMYFTLGAIPMIKNLIS